MHVLKGLRHGKVLVMAGATMLLVCVAASRASAGPIVLDTWYEFAFTDTSTDATACSGGCIPSSGTPTTDAGTPPWTYTTPAGGAYLFVTDAFLYGDSFEIFDFGSSLFSTPLVASGGSCGDDPIPCYFDPASSSASYFLAGSTSYSFTIRPTATVSAGAGYFALGTDRLPPSAVPEPATLLLMGSGLAAAGLRRRWSKRA